MDAPISEKAKKLLSNPEFAEKIVDAILREGRSLAPIVVRLGEEKVVRLSKVGSYKK